MAGGAGQGWTPERSVAGGRSPWLIVGVISIATFMVVLDTSIANVALAHIAGSLSASYDEASWVITSFLVANAVIIPISGWLADVIGRKRYYMMSVALFTISSLLCGLAPNLGLLIVARVLQGIGGGGLAPVEQSMLVDTFPPQKRGLAFAAYGVVVIVGPIAGPTLGGLLTDNLSWHWVFLINVPIGILSLFLVSAFVDEPAAVMKRTKDLHVGGLKIDFIGFALAALFLGCLEVTLDRGQQEDWFASSMIVSFALISAVAFIIFIPWELTRDKPIVAIRLFAQRNFAISNFLFLIVGLILFGSTLFIPQFLQQVLGYTATDAGLAMTAGGLATVIMMPIAGVLSGRLDARLMVGAAFALQGFALWNMTHLNTQITFNDAALARMWQAVGLPFLFVPITSIAYVGLRPEENNQASAMMNVTRNLGGTIGISMVQTMIAQRQQFHQVRLTETLNPLNPAYNAGIERITQSLQAHGLSPSDASGAAVAQLYHAMIQQTAMLSFIDAFHVMMIVIFLALPFVFLMRAPDKRTPAPVDAGL
jgi:DHA2 family multidrug resistance protein